MLAWAEAAAHSARRPVRTAGWMRRCVPATTPRTQVNVPWSRPPARWACCWKWSTPVLVTVNKIKERREKYEKCQSNHPLPAPKSYDSYTTEYSLSKQKGLGHGWTCVVLYLLLASVLVLFFLFVFFLLFFQSILLQNKITDYVQYHSKNMEQKKSNLCNCMFMYV